MAVLARVALGTVGLLFFGRLDGLFVRLVLFGFVGLLFFFGVLTGGVSLLESIELGFRVVALFLDCFEVFVCHGRSFQSGVEPDSIGRPVLVPDAGLANGEVVEDEREPFGQYFRAIVQFDRG